METAGDERGHAGGGMTFYFDAGRYAVFLWPAYAITALVIAGLIGESLWRARRWRREAEARERSEERL